MAPAWTHLVRFTHKGQPTFAQLAEPTPNGDLADEFKANIATGDPVLDNIKLTGEIVTVIKKDLLAPIATCPIVINTGLNYSDHVAESISQSWDDLYPPRPYIFYRPPQSIAAPFSNPVVYKAQQQCLDFEGEMIFQVGSQVIKDLTPEEAEKHIIGYAVGNDYSPRPGSVLGRMNFIWSKAFDNWTPVGPVLVHPSVLGSPIELDLSTRLDGVEMQKSNTRSMIFTPGQILSSMSYGHSVQPGTVVFSGTCSGGFWFTKDRNGRGMLTKEKCDVTIDKLGTISNVVTFLEKNHFLDDKLGAGGPPDKAVVE